MTIQSLLSGAGRVLARLVIGIVAGLALGAAYWAIHFAPQGVNLLAAARGEMEDAQGALQGLLALGGLCGAGVGLLAALRAALESPKTVSADRVAEAHQRHK
jgi:hypothetical protein